MPKPSVLRFSVLLAIAMLVPAVVGAQSFNGSISGAVKDPSGAIVSGAEMVLKNEARGVEFKYKSTDKGDYAFRNLTPQHKPHAPRQLNNGLLQVTHPVLAHVHAALGEPVLTRCRILSEPHDLFLGLEEDVLRLTFTGE